MAEDRLRVIVVGLGIQGRKRAVISGDDLVATVDTALADADYRTIEAVPTDAYDAALLCVPDEPKLELTRWLIDRGKHVLIEKPFIADRSEDLRALASEVRTSGRVCYTAYNHRFEPHFVRLKDTIDSGRLGEIYRVRLFYGNGTARDVRNSRWRDAGAGVLPDLGSHLLDALLFWFGGWPEDLSVWSAKRFENRAFDHVVCGGVRGPFVELEMSLLSWRNGFSCEVVGEAGSAHIDSLCKWGPSTFTFRRRLLPSGRPPEESVTLVQPDPTWQLEYDHFKRLIAESDTGNIDNDLRIEATLSALSRQALEEWAT